MKTHFFLTKKDGRRTLHVALSALILAATLALGVLLNALQVRANLYIDLTDSKLYTLSEGMKKELEGIEAPVTITFCADPDLLLANQKTRYVYIMAREIEKQLENITVVTCDVAKDPTAVEQFRATSATTIYWDHVILSTEGRYRLLRAAAFWTTDSQTGELYAFDGEYKMASALLSLTAVERPIAYFATGHGECVYDPQNPTDPRGSEARGFYTLLTDVGLEVRTLNLATALQIPDDCVLLILNDPQSDYVADPADPTGQNRPWLDLHARSPLEKIDRYLDNAGSLMVFKSPDVALPTLCEFLEEYGIACAEGEIVKDARAALSDGTDTETARENLLATYPAKDTLGGSLFSDIASLSALPKTVVPRNGYFTFLWENNEKRYADSLRAMTAPVLFSSDTARAYDLSGLLTDAAGSYPLATITTRIYSEEAADYYTYVFACAGTELVSNACLENDTYANYDILFSTVRTISRSDVYAADSLGGTNLNSPLYGGKPIGDAALSEEPVDVYENKQVVFTYLGMTTGAKVTWCVLLLLPPVALLIGCAYVCVRRRNT